VLQTHARTGLGVLGESWVRGGFFFGVGALCAGGLVAGGGVRWFCFWVLGVFIFFFFLCVGSFVCV